MLMRALFLFVIAESEHGSHAAAQPADVYQRDVLDYNLLNKIRRVQIGVVGIHYCAVGETGYAVVGYSVLTVDMTEQMPAR